MQLENEKTWNYLTRVRQRHGWFSVLHVIGLRFVNKFFDLRIFNVFVRHKVKIAAHNNEEIFNIKFLNTIEIEKYFGAGFNDITIDATRELISGQVSCLCVFDKKTEQIAAYSWFTNKSISTGFHDLDITFAEKYIYTLKVYTAPEYRGQQLHAWQMQFALDQYHRQNFWGIVGFTYSDNFESIKSNQKMGSTTVGHFWVMKIFGRSLFFKTGQVSDYEINLQRNTHE